MLLIILITFWSYKSRAHWEPLYGIEQAKRVWAQVETIKVWVFCQGLGGVLRPSHFFGSCQFTVERIASITDVPAPTNKQELQSFLGVLTYNARILPNLLHALHPLHQLLRKNATLVWKREHQKAFDAAKQMLSSDRALAHYDVNRSVKLFYDASAYGLGACLVHIMDDGSQKPLHIHHLHFPSLNEHMLRLSVRV